MKIQHWAIIFIIIILPFSVIARNTIQKKAALLKDETKYNNIVDNATYDAVNQLMELSNLDMEGKNLPISRGVANATIDRFFNTLAVNFNLPIIKSSTDDSISSAKSYFAQYIPAIVIVGYDGLYVYSYEENDKGYEYVLKPKIPYAYQYKTETGINLTINFTLDNYVKIYFPYGTKFSQGLPDADGYTGGVNYIEGYVGEFLDYDNDGIDDWHNSYDPATYKCSPNENNTYNDDDDPFNILKLGNYYGAISNNANDRMNYIMRQLPTSTKNLSYILAELYLNSAGSMKTLMGETLKSFGYNLGDFSGIGETPYTDLNGIPGYRRTNLKKIHLDSINKDYIFDDEGNIIQEASSFHQIRRETIIGTIQEVLKQEFNEHNRFTELMGITYDFAIPDIGRDQWNNTVDDVSILAFIQGIPMGYDSYYNNFSLGGARIIKSENYYAETVKDLDRDPSGAVHRVYHKSYCPLIPKDSNGNIIIADNDVLSDKQNTSNASKFKYLSDYLGHTLTGHERRMTRGVEGVYNNEADAYEPLDYQYDKKPRYYACSECM